MKLITERIILLWFLAACEKTEIHKSPTTMGRLSVSVLPVSELITFAGISYSLLGIGLWKVRVLKFSVENSL